MSHLRSHVHLSQPEVPFAHYEKNGWKFAVTCFHLVVETCLTGVEMQMGTKLFMTLCRKESSVALTD